MSKRRRGRATAPVEATPPRAEAPAQPRRIGESEGLAISAVALCALHAWLSRTALNPDGVSYLDLTRRAAAGDWSSFVQGYWSPLYPWLIALASAVTGRDAVSLVATAHAINGGVIIGAVILLWWWGRQVPGWFYTRAVIATLLLVSTG